MFPFLFTVKNLAASGPATGFTGRGSAGVQLEVEALPACMRASGRAGGSLPSH